MLSIELPVRVEGEPEQAADEIPVILQTESLSLGQFDTS